MTFLELTKDLTPQVQIHKAYADQSSHKISKVLSFNDDDEMSEEENPKTAEKLPTFN